MNITWKKFPVSMGIFKAKYAAHREETPEEFITRVASVVQPSIREKMAQWLAEGSFCFGGRTLYMAGRKDTVKASSSNCYILPMPKDTIESIYESNAQMARIFSRGGGVGVNISNLRPRGARVHNAAEFSTGAVSFLHLYNVTGEIIGARGRRAAEMVCINCDHPDVEELLHVKEKHEKLASMNISILFTDEFMNAVVNNYTFTLRFDSKDVGNPIIKEIDASAFFDEFCRVAWDMGDPGCLFNDRIQNYNYNSGNEAYQISASNPCAEFLGCDYSSCNLGSINVYNLVRNKFTDDAYVDMETLEDMTRTAVLALNDVLDYGYDNQPLAENKVCIDNWQQIGLGVYGLADAFIALKLTYGSEETRKLTDEIFYVMQSTALKTSAYLAKDRSPYKKYNPAYTLNSAVIQASSPEAQEVVRNYGLANGSLLSVAPTGSMSLFMGLFTGGIEPIFKLYYDRSTHKMEGEKQSFRVYARSISDLLAFHGIQEDLSDTEIKSCFPWVVEAHEIPYMERIQLQATMQKHIDNAISSTVNLPHSSTPDDIRIIYLEAWKAGCKGITVFRDGCARGNILGVDTPKKDSFPMKIKEETEAPIIPKHSSDADYHTCPNCGEKLFKVEGHCGYCVGCGSSSCSL